MSTFLFPNSSVFLPMSSVPFIVPIFFSVCSCSLSLCTAFSPKIQISLWYSIFWGGKYISNNGSLIKKFFKVEKMSQINKKFYRVLFLLTGNKIFSLGEITIIQIVERYCIPFYNWYENKK